MGRKKIMNQRYMTKNSTLESLDDFTVDFLNIDDIISGLGNMCRFNGQCGPFYSVAEHSVLCSQVMENYFSKDIRLIFAALVHDFSEAYLHDIIRPVQEFIDQHTVRDCYQNYDERFLHGKIQKLVGQKYKLVLEPKEYELILKIDNLLLDIEGSKFFGKRWILDPNAKDAIVRHHPLIKFLQPEEAKLLLLGRFTDVYKRYVAEGHMVAEAGRSTIPLRPQA
jgi:hypothetical protein